jgi:hypothetical protein
MAILPKATYMFNAIANKIPMTFITETKKKSTLKFVWKHKRPSTAKSIVRKKSNAGSITIPDIELYYRATTIKAAWYWHKTDMKTSGTEHRDMKPHNYANLIFYKGAKNI